MKQNSVVIFVMGVMGMYAYGVLSPQHYATGKLDVYIHYIAMLFLMIGAFVWYVTNQIKFVAKSTIFWLLAIIVMVVQPFLHHMDYIDSLIFPIAIFAMAAFVSITVANFSTKQRISATKILVWGVLIVAAVLVLTQLLQLFFRQLPITLIMPIKPDGRLGGNIAQVNQASYVIAMGATSIFYLYYEYRSVVAKYKILFGLMALAMFWFGMGIGFTASRGGLILMVAGFVGSLFYKWQSKAKFLVMLIVLAVITIGGYKIGTYLFNTYTVRQEAISSVSRLVGENTLVIRETLLQQAWMAFKQSPITGLGYEGYNIFGIQHPELPWFNNADNAHNVIAHIAAEYGILGLVCLAGLMYVGLKKILPLLRSDLPSYQVICLLLVAITFLYSLSEFPLWYPRFLLLMAFVLAMLDVPISFKNHNLNKIIAVVLAMFFSLNLYYIQQYDKYLWVQEVAASSNVPYENKIEEYEKLPSVFGYSKYKESIYYLLMKVDKNKLDAQINVGNRVLRAYGHEYFIEKQASLLAYANRKNEAKTLYHALCRQEQTGNTVINHQVNECNQTIEKILGVNPPNAEEYVNDLLQWEKDNAR